MPADVTIGLDDVELALADQPRMNFKLRAVVAEPDGCVAVEFVFALQLPRQPPQPFVCGAVGDTDRIDQPPAFVVVAALGGLVDGVLLVVTDVGHGLCTLLFCGSRSCGWGKTPSMAIRQRTINAGGLEPGRIFVEKMTEGS